MSNDFGFFPSFEGPGISKEYAEGMLKQLATMIKQLETAQKNNSTPGKQETLVNLNQCAQAVTKAVYEPIEAAEKEDNYQEQAASTPSFR
jgi:hypothetical protein